MSESSEERRSQLTKVAVVSLVFALALIIFAIQVRRGGPPISYSYYYDLSTGQMSILRTSGLATGEASNVVSAGVYSCGECSDRESRVVLWIEQLSSEAANTVPSASGALPAGSANESMRAVMTGHRVAPRPEPGEAPQWVPAASHQGMMLRESFRTFCSGQPAAHCVPTSAGN